MAILGQVGFKPGPALGRLCGAYNCDLSNEEKSRILHRYSGHAKITKARSNPHDSHKVVHDEVMLEVRIFEILLTVNICLIIYIHIHLGEPSMRRH